jgi:hypothetical protein
MAPVQSALMCSRMRCCSSSLSYFAHGHLERLDELLAQAVLERGSLEPLADMAKQMTSTCSTFAISTGPMVAGYTSSARRRLPRSTRSIATTAAAIAMPTMTRVRVELRPPSLAVAVLGSRFW